MKARMPFNPHILKDLQDYNRGECGLERLLGGEVTILSDEEEDGEKFKNYFMQDPIFMESLTEFRLELEEKEKKAKEKEAPLPTKV